MAHIDASKMMVSLHRLKMSSLPDPVADMSKPNTEQMHVK